MNAPPIGRQMIASAAAETATIDTAVVIPTADAGPILAS